MRLAALGSMPALILATTTLAAQASTEPPRQTEADAYTRYELLAPGSARFRIVYEVSATTSGIQDIAVLKVLGSDMRRARVLIGEGLDQHELVPPVRGGSGG